MSTDTQAYESEGSPRGSEGQRSSINRVSAARVIDLTIRDTVAAALAR